MAHISKVSVDNWHWWSSTQPNQTAHKPAANYRAVHHPIARWWTAGLIAGRISLILKSKEPMLSRKFLNLFGPFIT